MHSLNFEVIKSINQWLSDGDTVYLITITKTWGASPRPPGSIFTYNSTKNQQVGSLSGGCIEEDLVQYLQNNNFTSSTPMIKIYGQTNEQVKKFNLPCGGKLQLVLERLCPNQQNVIEHFKIIETHLSQRKKLFRQLSMKTGELGIIELSGHTNNFNKNLVHLTDLTLTHKLSPSYRLLIIGMGEITRYLAEMAESVEFSVTICDPRENFIKRFNANLENFELIHCLPDDLVIEKFNDEFCAIVALSHDPRVDDLALLAALPSQAFYVGAMGSSATSEQRIKRLLSLGLQKKHIHELKAPIGINIESKTPPEIAISVLAQLIHERYLHTRCK